MLGVDEGRGAAQLLAFGNGLQGEVVLPGFRPVDLDHAALRQAADPQCDVQHQRTGRDDLDGLDDPVAHAHHRAFAELLFDLAQGGGKGALLVLIHLGDPRQ